MSSAARGDPGAPEPHERTSRLPRFHLPEELGVLCALALLVVVIGTHNSDFVRSDNLFNLVASNSFFGMIALSAVFLLALGEIDLSVGWNFNLSAVIAALMMTHGWNPWIGAFVGILFGGLLGLVNGLLATGLRLPVIIVTLGTYSAYHGLSLVLSHSAAVVPPDDTGTFFRFSQSYVGKVPTLAIIFVVLAIVLHVVLQRTRFGFRVQAIGSNPEAARLAGIPAARTRILVLVLVGLVCGLAGSLSVGQFGAIDTNSGSDFLLTVVAAVIIGGTPLSGGSGTVIGALFGALIIATIASGIVFFNIDATWSTFVTGAVIILAVAVDQGVKWQRQRRTERRLEQD